LSRSAATSKQRGKTEEGVKIYKWMLEQYLISKRNDGLLREGECLRFAFIAAGKTAFPVRLLCRTLQVSRVGL
jgi:hypothetical protein